MLSQKGGTARKPFRVITIIGIQYTDEAAILGSLKERMRSTELSRDPSSMITNRSGGSVCRRTDRIVSAIYFAWLYDGMMQAIFWLIRQLLSCYRTPG